MTRWPLRHKLTLWTAMIVGAAVLCFGLGVAWHLYKEGMGNLDGELRESANEFFDGLGKHPARFDWDDHAAVQDLFPNARSLYFVEIAEPENRIVYRSRNLGTAEFPRDEKSRGHYTAALLKKKVRVGVFTHGRVVLRLAVGVYQVEETFEDLLIAYAVAMPLILILVGLAGWYLSRKALRPIEEIALAAERITARHLDQRLPTPGTRDELAHLTDVLNKMIDGLAASFAQATRFTADASHELKTPLTIIRGELEAALGGSDLSPAQERLLVNLLEETERLSGITEGLLLLSRADAGRFQLEKTPLDLSALLSEILEDVEILAAPHRITLQTELQPGVKVLANAQFLRQLLLNLFDNAIKYNEPGGAIRVRLTGGESGCVVSVANTGHGIPAKDAEHIFDRFYRGDAVRQSRRDGHGLGLSICREIARAHDGEIVVDPNPVVGWAEFRLTLPVVSMSEAFGDALGAT